jgi:hypothetical protein
MRAQAGPKHRLETSEHRKLHGNGHSLEQVLALPTLNLGLKLKAGREAAVLILDTARQSRVMTE